MIITIIVHCLQTGFALEVDGNVLSVRGTVLAVLADTLAAHQLGGFKVGVGFSLRKCRQCIATSDDMQTQVQGSTSLVIT